MVSTDDKEIARIAFEYGANVPFLRSPENADDHATTVDVLMEVLERYEAKDIYFENVCCIYPTAPFLQVEHLVSAYQHMRHNDLDSVFPVMQYTYPVHRALKIKQGRVQMVTPEHVHARSQDLEPAYHDCGQFYWFSTEKLKQQKTLFTGNCGAIVLNEMQGHDIDTESDWQVAEFKYKTLEMKNMELMI